MKWIIGIVLYFVGVFIAKIFFSVFEDTLSLDDEDDLDVVLCAFWPLTIPISFIFLIVSVCSAFAEKIADIIKDKLGW